MHLTSEFEKFNIKILIYVSSRNHKASPDKLTIVKWITRQTKLQLKLIFQKQIIFTWMEQVSSNVGDHIWVNQPSRNNLPWLLQTEFKVYNHSQIAGHDHNILETDNIVPILSSVQETISKICLNWWMLWKKWNYVVSLFCWYKVLSAPFPNAGARSRRFIIVTKIIN